MPRGFFITGTDTGVGKTLVTTAMLHQCRRDGHRAVGMKPVAAGCVRTPEGWINEDVAALRAASGIPLSVPAMNVYSFNAPIAPHIAAEEEGVDIDLDEILHRFHRLGELADVVLVEGAGGWLVPLDDQVTLADLADELGLPVVMVVGMRLGCINHALLTARSIEDSGLKLAGWVANRIDPAMARFEENLASLGARIDAPLLGVIPHQATPDPSRISLKLPL